MKTKLASPFLPVLLASLFLTSPTAQEPIQGGTYGACETPVYETAEVSRKAVVISKPEPSFTEEARANNVQGSVVLSAVLCSTGLVTDVQVIESLPHGLTEKAVESARRVKFRPAEKDGRAVSQRVTFVYSFNVGDGGCSETQERHVGRLVESVDIQGNRRTRGDGLLHYIGTRAGNPYDEAQIHRDLQALLDLRLFDMKETCVSIEEGARGGVEVIFKVSELPIIRDLQFEGLTGISESDVLRAFRENRIRIWKESVYDRDEVNRAQRVITELLSGRGWSGAAVEVSVKNVSSASVILTFVVSGQKAR